MSIFPELATSHPSWCDPASCQIVNGNPAALEHSSRPATYGFGDAGEVEVSLVSGPYGSAEATVYVRAGNVDEITIEQLDGLARWLTARAREYRRVIATEGGGAR